MHGSQVQESRDEWTKHFTWAIIVQNATALQHKCPKNKAQSTKPKYKVPAATKHGYKTKPGANQPEAYQP